jgi:fatty-acyl-CoA synthase
VADRTKDIIKSGGEWISSIRLENELMAHADVVEAAVVAVDDERWGERPHAYVVGRDEASVTAAALLDALADEFPRWWLPDEVTFVDELPKTATGKLDKKRLREHR